MSRAIAFVFLIVGFCIYVPGQTATTTNDEVQRQISRQDKQRAVRQARQRDADRAMGADRYGLEQLKRSKVYSKIENIYRKPNSEEMKLLSPHQEDLDRFAEFLSQKNTGLIKLIPDNGCADNPYVLVVSDKCIKYSMPGAGASYSFRKNTYRIPNLADITVKDGFLLTTVGTMTQGIIVNVGDVPLGKINKQTEGLSYILKFKPTTDMVKAGEFSNKLANGINENGFTYHSSLPIENNSTYFLRSVAYKGFIPRSVKDAIYDETLWDKRNDVTVALRIVRQDDDGSVTILWKRLNKKSAPKLKMDVSKK